MKCALCDKEITRTYSKYGNYCQDCSKKINDDLKTKNFNVEPMSIPVPKEATKENPFSAYNPNVFDDDKSSDYYTNEVADKLDSINFIIFILNIIGSISFIILYFVYDTEITYFLILGIAEFLLSILFYNIVKGISEIIKILDSINKKIE